MADRNFGLIRQIPDVRDRKLFSPRAVTEALPEEFDLSTSDVFGKVPQLDQGGLGSCGPNTADEDIMNDQIKQGMSVESASRLFIYYVTRALMGTIPQDSGVDNRTMLKALNKYGFCPESMWPYADDPLTFRKQPPASCFTEAAKNRITSYDGVTISLAQLQAAIYTVRRPVLFGFSVFQQIESDQAAQTGILTVPGAHENPIGGHDVSLVGWSNSRGMFKFRNHWMNGPNEPWGDNGYGWIPYDYATNPNLASDCWVINAVPGGVVPPPTPNPPPAPTPAPPLPGGWGVHIPAKSTDIVSVGIGP